ncbi:MAG: C-GCAxxG-C-C family protein [Acutalibacteraceae bacterium]
MLSKGDIAKNYFEQGYNCAQSVMLAFCDETGLDFDTSALIASGFGGGIGRLREVCGAVSGMVMALNMIKGYQGTGKGGAKAAHYALIQELCGKFRDENGSIVCKELLAPVDRSTDFHPEERTTEYYKKRPCSDLVKCAADILGEHLSSQN